MSGLQDIISNWMSSSAFNGRDAIVYDSTDGKRVIKYEMLWKSIQNCSAKLSALGVEPGRPVMVSMGNSIEAVVLIFSIWFAGGVYVPLSAMSDSNDDNGIDAIKYKITEFLRYCDSGSVLLFSDKLKSLDLEDQLYPVSCLDITCDEKEGKVTFDSPSSSSLSGFLSLVGFNEKKLGHLIFSADQDERKKRSSSDMRGHPVSRKLAYIMHTSGSSGKPKSVCISSRNLARRFESLSSGSTEPIPHQMWNAPLMFDASINEMGESLLRGGVLSFLDSARRFSADDVCNHIDKYKVSRLIAVPEVLKKIDPSDRRVKTLRDVTSMGESPTGWGLSLQEAISGAKLRNEWGPTENTIQSTENNKKLENGKFNDIGELVSGVKCYVLKLVRFKGEEVYQCCDKGEPGEMFLCGEQLSPGYLDKEQTSRAFCYLKKVEQKKGGKVDYFARQKIFSSGAFRVYQTGDIGSKNSEGRYMFHGRTMRLTKIRGIRYNLEEIQKIANLFKNDQGREVQVKVYSVKNSAGADVAIYFFVKRALASSRSSLFSNSVALLGDSSALTTDALGELNLLGWKNNFEQHLKRHHVKLTCPICIFDLKGDLKLSDFPLTANKKVSRDELLMLAEKWLETKSEDANKEAVERGIEPLLELACSSVGVQKCLFDIDKSLSENGMDSLARSVFAKKVLEQHDHLARYSDVINDIKIGAVTLHELKEMIDFPGLSLRRRPLSSCQQFLVLVVRSSDSTGTEGKGSPSTGTEGKGSPQDRKYGWATPAQLLLSS